MSNKNEFRGILDWNFASNYNEELIQNLISKKVIIDCTNYAILNDPYPEDPYLEELKNNSTEFDQFIIYNKKEYEVNPLILDDIYAIIKSNIKKFSYKEINKYYSEVSFKLIGLLDNDEKIILLKQAHSDLFDVSYDFENYEAFKSGKRWKTYFNLIIGQDIGIETIKYYLQYKDTKTVSYYYQDSISYKYQTLFSAKNPFYNQWNLFYQIKKKQDFLLKEINKLKASPKKYNLENITLNINRDKLVFKTPYACEFFIYLICQLNVDNPKIQFSYFFNIFKDCKHLNNNVQISKYLSFINNVFNTKEKRIRENLSSRTYNNYYNFYLKCKVEFNSLTQQNQ